MLVRMDQNVLHANLTPEPRRITEYVSLTDASQIKNLLIKMVNVKHVLPVTSQMFLCSNVSKWLKTTRVNAEIDKSTLPKGKSASIASHTPELRKMVRFVLLIDVLTEL